MTLFEIGTIIIVVVLFVSTPFVVEYLVRKRLKVYCAEIDQLKQEKADLILKDIKTSDYLTKYVALYEAGFIDREIKDYIGYN